MKRLLSILFAFACFAAGARAQFTTTPNVGFKEVNRGQTANWDTYLNGDFTQLDTLLGGVATLQLNGTTPSVAGSHTWITNSTSATAITNFVGGFQGQEITILCNDVNTTMSASATLVLASSFSCAGGTTKSITLILNGAAWVEKGRGVATSGCAVPGVDTEVILNVSGSCGISSNIEFAYSAAMPSLNVPGVNNIAYVGGPVSFWSGADVGAQVNSAYAALPTLGGRIYVLPQVSGACYNYSTPISFSAVGKYVILAGASTAADNGSVDGQVCLNFTPTTATNAILIDWTPSGGGGYEAGAGIRDLTLINNNCHTIAGCGSSAIGVHVGVTNGGAHKALFENVKVQGFQSGYHFDDGLSACPNGAGCGIGWGVVWLNSTTVWNQVGINYAVPHENDTYIGGAINSNGTGVSQTNFGGSFTDIGGSFDQNSLEAVLLSDGTFFHGTDNHWENTGATSGTQFPVYVYSSTSTSAAVDINGGEAWDDATSGTNSNHWFQGGLVEVNGLELRSFGRVTNVSVFAANTRGFYEAQPNPVSDFTGGLNDNSATNVSINTGNAAFPVVSLPQISTGSNCNVNSASPAACGSAISGSVVVPTTTTSYTVNTTAVTANSRIYITPITDNSGLSGGPTCASPATPFVAYESGRTAATSFTFTLPSTTGTTCWNYLLLN